MRLTMAVVLLAAGPAMAGPHPFHDDGGAINWKPSLRAALDAARVGGKPVFIEAGRKG